MDFKEKNVSLRLKGYLYYIYNVYFGSLIKVLKVLQSPPRRMI